MYNVSSLDNAQVTVFNSDIPTRHNISNDINMLKQILNK